MRWLRILFSVVLSALFLWLLLRGRDITQLAREIRTVGAAELGTIAVLLVAGHGGRILRWGWMLRRLDAGIRYRACIGPYLIGVSLNNVAPLRAGDIYRVLAFPAAHVGRTQLFGVVVLERALDFAVLFLFLIAGTMALHEDAARQLLLPWISAAALIGGIIAAAACVWASRMHAFGAVETSGAPGDAAVAAPGPRSFLRMLRTTLRTFLLPLHLAILIALTLFSWTMTAGIFSVVAITLGAPTVVPASLFATASANLAGLLPSAPGSIGTFHFFAAWAYAVYGVAWNTAAALAVIVHAVFWVPMTVVGLGFLVWRHVLRRGHAFGVSGEARQPDQRETGVRA